MTVPDSFQCGGGRLRVFVLDGEAESPITQFVYSTQTQFVTASFAWGRSIIRFNLIETGSVGVMRAEHRAGRCLRNCNLPFHI